MVPIKQFDEQIRVLVTKRLPKDEIAPIVQRFVKQQMTFAVCKVKSSYEVWRQIMPGDQPRVKNRKEGMTPNGIIEQDKEDVENRNFICIWDHGKPVYGDPHRISN